jgi:hypothetical protein
MTRIVTLACMTACAVALLLIGCGSEPVTSTASTIVPPTLAAPTSTISVPTTLVPTTVVTLPAATTTSGGNTTTTTGGSVTTQRAVPLETDRELLVALTKGELRATGNEALYEAEVSRVDVFGTWAATYVIGPPGYEPGCVLFHAVDGKWKVVEGLGHQFVETSLIEDGVPKDIIDSIIEAGYAVSPE